jgi:Na+/H+-dicarboxylate symporter
MSLTIRILLALLVGLAAGAALAATGVQALPTILSVAQPIGALWLDALRMTIVPLVFSLIVTGVVSAAGAAQAGGITARALFLFALFLLGAGVFSALATPAFLAMWPIPAGAAEAFRGGLSSAAAMPSEIPPFQEWLKQIVPSNPVGAAAEGAMLPLVMFALVFGFALSRIEPQLRERLSGVFEAIVQTMLTIVHWVLLAAPIGIFALALGVGARSGLGAAGALLHYVVLISAVCIGVTLCLYVGIALFSKVSVRALAKAAAPAQVVAFSTQSSLASLPAMVEGARHHLGVPQSLSNLVLPLAVSLFRITSPAANLGVALYLTYLFDIEVSIFQIAAAVAVAAVVSLASVGLPSQVSFFSVVAPVCLTLGAPIEMLGLLIAVETIPDIFRTVGNVTGDVAVTGVAAVVPGASSAEGNPASDK